MIDGPSRDALVMAREARGLTQTELAERVGVTQAAISQYESGLRPIPNEQVEALAKALNFRAAFFATSLTREGLASACAAYRRRRAASVRQMRQLEAQANILAYQVQALVSASGYEAENTLPRFDIDEFHHPERIAEMFRETWRVPLGPIRNLVGTVEAAGVFISSFDFGTTLIDAMSIRPRVGYPVLLLNAAMPADRTRLSLAHEVGHLSMHWVPNDNQETEAQEFAAAFLMPAHEIRHDLRPVTLNRLAQLKPSWGVSIQAMIRRARDLELISESAYRGLFAQMGRMGYRTKEPIELKREQPTSLRSLVSFCKEKLDCSIDDLARIVGVYEDEFLATFLPSTGPLRIV